MRILHQPAEIEAFLLRDPARHVYELGDLSPDFFRHSIFFGWPLTGPLEAVALLYVDEGVCAVLSMGEGPSAEALARALPRVLPARFYAHLAPGLRSLWGVQSGMQLGPAAPHHRMRLVDPGRLVGHALPVGARVVPLRAEDEARVRGLYAAAYPDTWFTRRQLATGVFRGIETADGALVAIAGVHVLAERIGVAALGNIATHPDHRGQGLGRAVTAALCLDLRARLGPESVIGLNVAVGNRAAQRAYRAVGFEVHLTFDEQPVEQGALRAPPPAVR